MVLGGMGGVCEREWRGGEKKEDYEGLVKGRGGVRRI